MPTLHHQMFHISPVLRCFRKYMYAKMRTFESERDIAHAPPHPHMQRAQLGTRVRANIEWEVRRARADGEQWQGVAVAELLGEKVKQRY